MKARGRRVALGEALKNAWQGFRAHADPGIGDGEANRLAKTLRADVHAASLSEFQGVGDQVADHLTQSQLVAAPITAKVRRDFDIQPKRFLARQIRKGATGDCEHVLKIEVTHVEAKRSSLDLGEIE